jgi:hypothetical protein
MSVRLFAGIVLLLHLANGCARHVYHVDVVNSENEVIESEQYEEPDINELNNSIRREFEKIRDDRHAARRCQKLVQVSLAVFPDKSSCNELLQLGFWACLFQIYHHTSQKGGLLKEKLVDMGRLRQANEFFRRIDDKSIKRRLAPVAWAARMGFWEFQAFPTMIEALRKTARLEGLHVVYKKKEQIEVAFKRIRSTKRKWYHDCKLDVVLSAITEE